MSREGPSHFCLLGAAPGPTAVLTTKCSAFARTHARQSGRALRGGSPHRYKEPPVRETEGRSKGRTGEDAHCQIIKGNAMVLASGCGLEGPGNDREEGEDPRQVAS